ncbi:ferredoxin [Roseobacteraceae bacterium S113]
MVTLRETLEARCAPYGLAVLGVVEDDGRWIALIGMTPEGWAHFKSAPEFSDGAADPLDRWSQRVIPELAAQNGAESHVYPFGGPPYQPFIRWSFESGETFSSPVGMLVHARAGFWISFRGALVFDRPLDKSHPENPCPPCAKPCTTACPVGALAPGQDYDVPRCKAHVASAEGRDCKEGGCRVRRACPVSQSFGRAQEQSAFHMRAFLGGDI